MVDAADYTVWRGALSSSTILVNEGATPGQVTAEDYLVWRDTFGKRGGRQSRLMKGVVRYDRLADVGGAAVARVPEPAAMSVWLFGVGVFALAKPRRSGQPGSSRRQSTPIGV